jgi:hypothetical protein
MPPCDWEFDTTTTSANEIASSTLAAALSPPTDRIRRGSIGG